MLSRSNAWKTAKPERRQRLGTITRVILPNQVLEMVIVGRQVGPVRVDKPVAYLDIDDAGLVEAGYGPATN